MLCDKCRNIHFRPLEDCDFFAQHLDRFQVTQDGRHMKDEYVMYSYHNDKSVVQRKWSFSDLSKVLFSFHHESIHALRASASQGCHFCGMMSVHLNDKGGKPRPRFFFQHGEVVLSRLIDRHGLGTDNIDEDVDGNHFDIHWDDMTWTTVIRYNYNGKHSSYLRQKKRWIDLT